MAEAFADKRIEYLTSRQLAEHLQVSESTVNRLRRSGRIPAVYVTDRLVRYNLRDVRRALGRQNERDAAEASHDAAHDNGSQMDFADVFAEFDRDGLS